MIRFLAAVTAISGIYVLISRYHTWYGALNMVIGGGIPAFFWKSLIWTLIIDLIVPIFKLIGAFALYRLYSWSRVLIIYSLLTDIFIRLYLLMKFILLSGRLTEGTVRGFDWLPSAVIIGIGMVTVLLLMKHRAQLLDVPLVNAKHRKF